MNIAIVTDSTSDIPKELVERYQIHVVPNLVIIDGISFEDGKDISREEFYDRLPAMQSPPTTATASTGSYQLLYDQLLQQGFVHIVSIHAASLLSGIFNAASAAAQAFSHQVSVIDSEHISMGLGFQVLAAAEAVVRGDPLEKVLAMIHEERGRVHVVAMLDTLEYVRRSGRVSWARARIGNLLRIKPFLQVKGGQVFSLGETRTRRKGIARLHQMLSDLGVLERLAILHTNALDDAIQFLNNTQFDLSTEPEIINVTTVIGTHVGPNGLGFAAVVK